MNNSTEKEDNRLVTAITVGAIFSLCFICCLLMWGIIYGLMLIDFLGIF